MSITDEDRQRIIEAIRTYMARERISREEFAQRAKLGKSTIDKLATGIFSERTILQIEARLNIKLRDAGASTATAPAEYGSYTREEASYFIGEYVFARPSFQEDGIIQAFRMEIVWGPKDNVSHFAGARARRRSLPAGRQDSHTTRLHPHICRVQ